MTEKKSAVWQIRLSSELKDEFFSICDEKALNTSEVVRRLMARWIKEQKEKQSQQIKKKRGNKKMYAIAFDLKIDDLKKAYGEPYNRAYDEIRQEMESLGFSWTQGSLYINNSNTDNLAQVYKAINKLSKISWFKDSVRDIRAFKVEDWSDFTEIVKE